MLETLSDDDYVNVVYVSALLARSRLTRVPFRLNFAGCASRQQTGGCLASISLAASHRANVALHFTGLTVMHMDAHLPETKCVSLYEVAPNRADR